MALCFWQSTPGKSSGPARRVKSYGLWTLDRLEPSRRSTRRQGGVTGSDRFFLLPLARSSSHAWLWKRLGFGGAASIPRHPNNLLHIAPRPVLCIEPSGLPLVGGRHTRPGWGIFLRTPGAKPPVGLYTVDLKTDREIQRRRRRTQRQTQTDIQYDIHV